MHQRYINFLAIALVLLLSTSCRKKEEKIDNQILNLPKGYALVSINLPEITTQEESLSGNKKAIARFTQENNNSNTQTLSTASGGLECAVSLTPEYATNTDFKSNKLAEKVTKPVDLGVRYRLYAFEKESGKLVDSATYTRGQEANAADIKISREQGLYIRSILK